MARVNLDDDVWTDVRFDMLAASTGWDRDLAVGRIARLWRFCYGVGEVITEAQAKHVLQVDAKHLVDAELGEWVLHDEGRLLRVRGVKERRRYLDKKAEAGRQGGVKSGESRRSKREANASLDTKQKDSTPEPSSSALPLAPDLPLDPDLSASPEAGPRSFHVDRKTAHGIWYEFTSGRTGLILDGIRNDGDGLVGDQATDDGLEMRGFTAILRAFGPDEVRRALRVAFAEARKARSLRWLGGGKTTWSPGVITYWLEHTPESVPAQRPSTWAAGSKRAERDDGARPLPLLAGGKP